MARNYTKVLLITANVGSIFEDFKSDSVPDRMLDLWLNEFLGTIKRIDPGFLVVHCQEVGGKNYEESMQHVNQFVKRLLGSAEMQQFDKARVFLDEDFTAVDKFTALGSLYFVHQSIQNVQLFDFQEKKFVPVKGREVLSGNIESVPIKEKAKFPQEFFPDFKWSRKGFLRTRWNLCNTTFDLVNIHLFHDASNIAAMESSPSTYTRNRRNALRHTIERFETDEYGGVPFFMFGDFNFRLDTRSLIKKLTDKTDESRTKGKKNDISKIVYTSKENGKTILTVEKKGFDYQENHNEVFSNNNNKWLHEYDQEPKDFSDKLYEYEVTFPPSYPFSEDVQDGTSYMKTRCPAWCDRVMCSYDIQEILIQDESPIEYNMIGPNICMGDHKPIYLSFKLRHNSGKDDYVDSGVKEGAVEKVDRTVQEISDDEEIPTHLPLTKVISINGETVDISDMEQFDIHDNATFEQEQYFSEKFNSTKRSSKKQPYGSPPRFFDVVQGVIRAESVVRALRHYHHRSDSESEEDQADDPDSQTAPPASQGSKGADDILDEIRRIQEKNEGDNLNVVSPSTLDVEMTTNNNYTPSNANATVLTPFPSQPGKTKDKDSHAPPGGVNIVDLHNGSRKSPGPTGAPAPTRPADNSPSDTREGCPCCVVL